MRLLQKNSKERTTIKHIFRVLSKTTTLKTANNIAHSVLNPNK